MNLKGKHVWITGAAGALGSELVRQCAAAGAHVSASDLHAAACQALAQPGAILAVPCDIAQYDQVVAAYRTLRDTFGPVDVLIANAGITHFSPMQRTEIRVYEAIMQVNLFGALYCTKLCLDDIEQRAGAIIAVSSAAGFGPLAERTGYAASKHAMNGMFTSLGAELQRAQVYVACPSFIRDDSGQKAAAPGAGDGIARPGADASKNHGKGMTNAEAAHEILALIGRQGGVYPIGRVSRLAWRLQRLSPSLYRTMMLRGMKRD